TRVLPKQLLFLIRLVSLLCAHVCQKYAVSNQN
ncbi:MAG: hypothetical protein ACI846_001287, partial [Pseudoalteromonas distincta]